VSRVRDELDRAGVLLEERRWSEADAAYTSVIESGTSDELIAEAYRGRSGCRLMAGDLGAAVADAVVHAELAADDPRAWLWMASLLQMGREHAGVIEAYRHAFALGCDDPAAWCASAEARLELGDFEGALEDLARAVTAHPRFVRARLARAHANASAGRLEAAIEDWQAAIALDPAEALRVDGYISEARRRIAAVAHVGRRLAIKVLICGPGAFRWVRRIALVGGGVVGSRGRMEIATIPGGTAHGLPVIARYIGVEEDPGEIATDAHEILLAAELDPEAATLGRISGLIARILREEDPRTMLEE
jgi:tetratricopeptide (TPR) repeat protein